MNSFRVNQRGLDLAILGALSLSVLTSVRGLAQEAERADANDKLYLYSVSGVLDADGSFQLIKDISAALENDPKIRTVILRIDSPGTQEGRLEPAEQAAKYLDSLKGGRNGVRVVSWILQDKSAGNASALLALAAQDLFMSPGAKLGFIQNPPGSRDRIEVPDSDEKEADQARKVFKEFAGRRRGPEGLSLLASSMVSKFHKDIYKVRFEKMVGKDSTVEIRFLLMEQLQNLRPEDHQMKKEEFVAVPAGQKLTLDQKRAHDYEQIAVAVESDNLSEVLHKLKLNIGPENIIDPEQGGILKQNQPAVQTLVDFFNHPVTRFFLILCGILGLLLEFKMPGTLVPTLLSLGCFAIFFIAGLHGVTGAPPTANLWEIVLFVLGLGFVAVELLLLPGVLIFGMCGAAACLISIVLAMVPSSGSTMDYKDAFTTLIASSASSAAIFILLLKFLPRTRFFNRSGIVIYSSIQGTPTTDTAIEAQTRDATLIGKVGTALTALRPAGAAEFDGARIDVVTDGEFIEKGDKVQIIDLDGTRTLVKRA